MATFPATKDVIKLTKISTFTRIFILLQISKQIKYLKENHVEEIVVILTIYTALKLTHEASDDFISY